MAKILHFLKDHIPQFSHRLLVEKNLRKYLWHPSKTQINFCTHTNTSKKTVGDY